MAEPVVSHPAPPWSNKYDANVTKKVINRNPILHLTFPTNDEKYPTVCYLVGKILKYKHHPEALYVHGHIQEPVKFRLEHAQEVGDEGIPVSIAASTIDSYVLGFSGFATGYSFHSTVLNGTASLIPMTKEKENKDERMFVMTEIVNAQVHHRWNHIRDIMDDVDYVSIIKVIPDEKRSHTHSLPAALGFEMDQDIKNLAVVDSCWEGAIPVWQAFGDPIAGEHNKVDTPHYLKKWVINQNMENEAHAYEVAKKRYPYDPFKF